jgi:hypothetical protein
MTHESTARQPTPLPVPQHEQVVACLHESCWALAVSSGRRGRPATVSACHLCLGIVLCGLRGFGAHLGLWRLLCLEQVGPFAPVGVGDQAVYNRVARAAGLMESFFRQVSSWMRQQLVGWEDRQLAPFATQVLALDERTLAVVGRWLPELRQVLAGDARLLAGRISALFDVRVHQWVRVDVLAEASANCKQHARETLVGLQAGVLLLFARGYLSFPWFDELTERGLWWISRSANGASFQVRHVLSQGDGVLDAIAWLGTYRADRAKYPVRLVQDYQHGHLRRYLTNVLDPQQLPLAEVARLYARRWALELAFGVLKEHWHLGQLWSAKWAVICVQIWCGLLLAQLFHGLQVHLAAQEGVDPFEVSLDLLGKVVPSLLQQGHRSLALSGAVGSRVGPHPAQHPHPGADPLCGSDLAQSTTTGGLAAAGLRPLCPAQLCAQAQAQDQESGVIDGLV